MVCWKSQTDWRPAAGWKQPSGDKGNINWRNLLKMPIIDNNSSLQKIRKLMVLSYLSRFMTRKVKTIQVMLVSLSLVITRLRLYRRLLSPNLPSMGIRSNSWDLCITCQELSFELKARRVSDRINKASLFSYYISYLSFLIQSNSKQYMKLKTKMHWYCYEKQYTCNSEIL